MTTLDEAGKVLEEQPDNVVPIRPAPGAEKAEKPKRAARRKVDDAPAASPTLKGIIAAGAEAATQADTAVADAWDANVQAVSAVGNLGKWVLIGFLAWVVFSATESKD